MSNHTRSAIFTLFISLWTVVIAHEAIPHYHPHGDGMRLQLITHQNTPSETPVNDESGILDDLLVLYKKKAIDITPHFQSISADCFRQFQYWSAKNLLVYLKLNRTNDTHSMQFLIRNAQLLFRGPPILI